MKNQLIYGRQAVTDTNLQGLACATSHSGDFSMMSFTDSTTYMHWNLFMTTSTDLPQIYTANRTKIILIFNPFECAIVLFQMYFKDCGFLTLILKFSVAIVHQLMIDPTGCISQ